jgi:hypothetical protein
MATLPASDSTPRPYAEADAAALIAYAEAIIAALEAGLS